MARFPNLDALADLLDQADQATGEHPTHHGRGTVTTDQVRRAMLTDPDDDARPADQGGDR